MAKAKKKTTKKKSTSKGKGAKKAGTAASGDLDDLFSGGVASKKKKPKGKDKDDAVLPDHLKEACDIYVSATVVSKAVEAKGKLAKKKVYEYTIEQWCKKFVQNGVRPPTCTYHGEETQFDFIQTKRIDMNADKIKGLQMLGFDPLEEDENGERKYVHVKGMNIDLVAVRKLGGVDLQDKLKAALGKVLAEHAAEVLTPVVSFKDNFVDNMANIARESVAADLESLEVLDGLDDKDLEKAEARNKKVQAKNSEIITSRLETMVKILMPRTSSRNAASTASDEECFTYVVDAEFGEED